MKKPKIAFLLEALSLSERKNFESVIENKKRQQLFQLYKIVKSELKKNEFSNERIFELLYHSPYKKEKNYLLRNELRLLSNELKEFLVRLSIEKKIKENNNVQTLLYLEALSGKTNIEFFLSECQKALATAKDSNDYLFASQIFQLYIETFVRQSIPTHERYLSMLDYFEKNENLFTQAFLENWVVAQKFKAFILKTLNVMHPEQHKIVFPKKLILDLENEKKIMPFFHYQMLWAKSYGVENDARIELLKKAEQLIQKIQKPSFLNESETAKINASIALDYFLKSDYRNSLVHHEKMLERKKHIRPKDFSSYLFNYISTLLRMDNFSKALQLISANKNLLTQERLHDRFLNIKAMCLLLLNQFDEAEACLPPDRKEGGMYNYFYFRVVQSMIFFTRKEYDLAINELQNLQFSLHYNQLKGSGFKQLTMYLQNFYKLQRDQNFISNYDFEKQKMIVEIDSLDDNRVKFQYLLPYKWLVKMMKN